MALRSIFGVASDAELGFHQAQQAAAARVITLRFDPDSEDPVDRRQFVQGAALLALGAAVDRPLQPWLGMNPSASVRAGRRVGMSDVAAIENVTDQLHTLDHSSGGGLFVDAGLGQLNGASTLLDKGAFASEAVRQRLARAVAHLAKVTGWSAYDAGLHGQARRALSLGVHAATEGDDWPLRASILSDLARQAVTLGQPREALDLTSLALYGARDTATPATIAMLHVVSARAYGWAGDASGCLDQVAMADHAYAEPGSDDPPWITFYIPAQLFGDSGSALFDAAHADPELRGKALTRLSDAAAEYGPRYPRSQALCLARVAALRFDDQEPDEAKRVGLEFADVSQGIRSARLVQDSHMVTRHAAPFLDRSDVADLTHRLTGGRDA